jgi:hypothetical protein
LTKEMSPETNSPPGLTAFHCAQIGLFALYREFYDLAIEWIETAIDKVYYEYDSSIPLTILEDHLELVVKAVSIFIFIDFERTLFEEIYKYLKSCITLL